MEEKLLYQEIIVETFEKISKNLQLGETALFNSAEDEIRKCFEMPMSEFYKSVTTSRNTAGQCIIDI